MTLGNPPKIIGSALNHGVEIPEFKPMADADDQDPAPDPSALAHDGANKNLTTIADLYLVDEGECAEQILFILIITTTDQAAILLIGSGLLIVEIFRVVDNQSLPVLMTPNEHHTVSLSCLQRFDKISLKHDCAPLIDR